MIRNWSKKIWLLSSFGALLVLGGLVLAFVQHARVNSEIRDKLEKNIAACTEPPRTRPLSHVVWNVRRAMGNGRPPRLLERRALAFVEGRLGVSDSALWAFLSPEELLPSAFRLSSGTKTSTGALDGQGVPLRWNPVSRACRLSPETKAKIVTSLSRISERKKTSNALRRLASPYSAEVNALSRRFNLKPDLIFAIMYIESRFNPALISTRNAHGLMQVVPRTAGGEVKAWLGEAGHPTPDELLDPFTNIKYGAAYLRLLLKRHFGPIKDSLAREYCAIAAYNSGSTPVLRVFGPNREVAFAAINTMNADEVLELLLSRIPSRETRGFLRKVLESRQHFIAMN